MYRLAFALCLLLLSGGCTYVGFTAGPGGKGESSPNFALEYDFSLPGVDRTKTVKHDDSAKPGSYPAKRDWMFIGGNYIVDNAIDIGWFKSSPEVGGFVKLCVEVMPDTGFFANVLGGFSAISWTTAYDEGTEWYGVLGGGFTYFVNDNDFCIIASYDNRRLFNAGVGFRF